jgi:hypothetical protein
MTALAREVMHVASALGVTPLGFDGFEPARQRIRTATASLQGA